MNITQQHMSTCVDQIEHTAHYHGGSDDGTTVRIAQKILHRWMRFFLYQGVMYPVFSTNVSGFYTCYVYVSCTTVCAKIWTVNCLQSWYCLVAASSHHSCCNGLLWRSIANARLLWKLAWCLYLWLHFSGLLTPHCQRTKLTRLYNVYFFTVTV